MRTRPGSTLAAAVLAIATAMPGATADRDAPQWSQTALDAAEQYAAAIGTHAFLLVDGSGAVIRSYGPVDEPMPSMSIRKSFVSALFGILADEGRVDLDATLEELGIDDHQGLTAAERQATIRDLLASRSGVYHPAAYETPGMQDNRPARGSHPPGSFCFYNNWDFNALATILEQVSGESVVDLFMTRLAEPLGMEDFDPARDFEIVLEPVSRHPAIEFSQSARDLARFGRLFLAGGHWGGAQIVPEDWVRESTSVISDLGMFGGYGYSWWVAHKGEHFPFLRFPDGTFSARGTGEQILLVLPHLNAVWVHRTELHGPDGPMMSVIDSARLLGKILDAAPER